MPSEARRKFDENCKDVQRLLEIHADIGGDQKGRRWGLEVLNKSAIVLICAFWEAYCEDIAAEGLVHLVTYAKSAKDLPVELRKSIAAELKADKHELAVWGLAGEGWRTVLTGRLERLQEERNRHLNTPKSAQIDDLFQRALGIGSMSDTWKWDRTTPDRARAKLNKYVTLRGDIAHRGQALGSTQKKDVEDFFEHVKALVSRTGGRVNRVVRTSTGRRLW